MKLKIEKVFTDKFTSETYAVGDVKDFEDARAKELLNDSRKLVSEVKEVKEVKEPIKKATKKTSKK